MGRGSDVTRPPRLPLQGADGTHVEQVMEEALRTRPTLKTAAE